MPTDSPGDAQSSAQVLTPPPCTAVPAALGGVAPAGRWTLDHLLRASEALQSVPLLQQTLDALPYAAAILNEKRQVVLASRALREMLGSGHREVLGQRPGELLGCIHAGDGPDGCGTSPNCSCCGAVAAILHSQDTGEKVRRECRLRRWDGSCEGALDLAVTAAPLDVEGRRFLLVTMEDIAERKRLQVLARAFFHDVLNTAGGIQGYAHLVATELSRDATAETSLARLAALTAQLVEEIESQRDLMCAEAGELEPELVSLQPMRLLEDLRALYSGHTVGLDKRIELAGDAGVSLLTDARLLARVIGNMLKNALEASAPGGTVTMACCGVGEKVVLTVHNESVMPREVQMQVFQRSFSTKGEPGRGVGTHSIKLLGERYLGGKVSFTSRAREGTTFALTLPKVPQVTIQEELRQGE